MSEPITQGHEYRDAFQYLKMSERTGLTETLTTFSQSLRKNGGKNSEILETVQKAEAFIKELKDIGKSDFYSNVQMLTFVCLCMM